MDIKEKLKIAENIVKTIERVIKTNRMYNGISPKIGEFREDLLQYLKEFLKEEELIISIGYNGYYLGNEMIYEETNNIENSNVYFLYKTGIRSLVFNQDLKEEELSKFIDILLLKRSNSSDIVTRLWEADFKTILYSKIETFYQSDSEQDLLFENFKHWIRRKETPMQKDFQAFGFDVGKKKKKYRAQDLKDDLKIVDNEKLFDELKDKHRIEILESDKSYIFDNLKYDLAELPERWSKMTMEVIFKFDDLYKDNVDFIFEVLDHDMENSSYLSLYRIFYDLKDVYQNLINKKKAIPIIRSFYQKLLEPQRLDRFIESLENLKEDNYKHFNLFLQQLNPKVVEQLSIHLAKIKDNDIRKKIIDNLEAMGVNPVPYYKSIIENNPANITEGFEGIEKLSISRAEKVKFYKTMLNLDSPPIMIILLKYLEGHYDSEMSTFYFKALRSKSKEVIDAAITYIKSIDNEDAIFKAVRFIETPYFNKWSIQYKQKYLALLVLKAGKIIGDFLINLFNSKQSNEELKISIIFSLGFLVTEKNIKFLQSINKKFSMSKKIKQEASNSLERLKMTINKK